jgi:hypothetical protein
MLSPAAHAAKSVGTCDTASAVFIIAPPSSMV